jgi:hypoxanthine phosphoribosyltransferase
MLDDIDHVLFTEDQLAARVKELGAQITQDYAENPPLVICILRGAATFACDLCRAIDLPVEIDYMAISSYGAATRSSGILRIVKDLDTDVKDRDVIVVEDVLDSGLTLRYLTANLAARGVRSCSVATLLCKRTTAAIDPRYVGFQCPDEFVVGYGLDYAQKYRNLPYIGVLKPSVYEA